MRKIVVTLLTITALLSCGLYAEEQGSFDIFGNTRTGYSARISFGYQTVSMAPLNDAVKMANGRLSSIYYTQSAAYSSNPGGIQIILGGDYDIGNFYAGPRTGIMVCLAAKRTYEFWYPSYNTAVMQYTASLVPLLAEAGYKIPIKARLSGIDMPMYIDISVNAGWAFAGFTDSTYVNNSSANGTYTLVSNYYGSSPAFGVAFGASYGDTALQGIKFGVKAGYNFCSVAEVRADKEYKTTSSKNRVITVKKDQVFSVDGQTPVSMDFSGFIFRIEAKYAF